MRKPYSMKPTYDELKTQLDNTQQQLDNTQQQLDNTQQQLDSTQQQLDSTQQQLDESRREARETRELLKKALEKIQDLEEHLNLNSKNSSKPPSTDLKGNSPEGEPKPRQQRKGFSRPVFPPERVDRRIECTQEKCSHCGSDNIQSQDLEVILQQVDLPEVRAILTEYLRKKYECGCCGKKSVAPLPKGIPNSAFGTSLMGLLATLTGVFHLAKREAVQLIKDLYDIDLSTGSCPNIEERVSAALDPIYQRIQQVVLDINLCKHFDETGWRTGGKRRYVWIATSQVAAYYRIDPRRSGKAFSNLLGNTGERIEKVVTDRYAVYNRVDKLHQYCLAHLIRDFQRFAEKEDPDDKEIGSALAMELAKACKIHGLYREEKISKKQRNMRLGHLRGRVKYWLEYGHANGSDKLSRLCESMLDQIEKLWVFTKVDGMEPTNNQAERDLRKLVIWRKKSYGTKSDRGEGFVERITSVAQTLRKHGRNVLHFMQSAVRNHYRGELPPEISPAHGI